VKYNVYRIYISSAGLMVVYIVLAWDIRMHLIIVTERFDR
jgi:hypothetical protein